MCRTKRAPPHYADEKDPDREAFFASALKHMDELDEIAGDWRTHLPYEALISFRADSAVREQYADHLNTCEYCQEAMDTLNPFDKS